MKKQFLLCAALLSCTVIARAQNPDTAQLLVHYKFSHIRDTTNREHPYTENMVLIVGKTAGAYKSYDKRLQDALFKKQVQEQMANSADGRVNIQRRASGSGTEYYQFPNGKKLVRKEPLLFNSYLMTDALPVIDWKISGDKQLLEACIARKQQLISREGIIQHGSALICRCILAPGNSMACRE